MKGFAIGRRKEPDASAPGPAPADAEVRAFVDALTEDERMLVVVRDGLYDGDWEAMLGDLRARLAGRPYIFKLVNRIQDDIAHIEKLAAFERAHALNLAEYVEEGGDR